MTCADIAFAYNHLEVLYREVSKGGVMAAAQGLRVPMKVHEASEDVPGDLERWQMNPEFRMANRANLGWCQAFRRDDFFRLRGFDEDFYGWGRLDEDLFERARQIGLKEIWVEREAPIYHLEHRRRHRQRRHQGRRNNAIAAEKDRELTSPERNQNRTWGLVYDKKRITCSVFLDRDGVINAPPPDREHYVTNWEKFKFLPGAIEGVRKLWDAGCMVHIVTNQSGLGKKLFTKQDLEHMHVQMLYTLEEKGAFIANINTCPHLPNEGCKCRKPETGSLSAAIQDYREPPVHKFMVGDQPKDMETGRRFGCRSVLIRSSSSRSNGNNHGSAKPECEFDTLPQAAQWIIEQIKQS